MRGRVWTAVDPAYAEKGWFPQKKADRLPATYTRKHGVRHLFAALDLKTDKLYAHNKKTKRHQDFLGFLQVLRRRFHRSERLYIILDNFSPHHHKKVKAWAEKNHVKLVYTPTYASWLNRIECHFGPLRKFVLEGSNYSSHDELMKAIQEYIRWRNKNKRDAVILNEQNKIKVA